MNTESKSNRLPCPLHWSGAVLLIVILMLPSLYWIVNDHHVWPWDQAWYGESSVDLWFKLTRLYSDWWVSMVAAFGMKAPGIAWLGQFFTPIAYVTGLSMETGLLFSVFGAQLGTLFFAWKISEALVPKRGLVVCAGILVFASAPLFVAMSHQYVTEPLQLFGVTYFFFLAVKGRSMQRVTLLGNLMIATSIALLAKVTSPIYCGLPGLIATCALFTRREAKPRASGLDIFGGWFSLLLGLSLCVLTGIWYSKNIEALRANVKLVTTQEFTLPYGKAGTFFQKVPYWLNALLMSFETFWVVIGLLILFGVAIAVTGMRSRQDAEPRPAGRGLLNLLTIASVIHVLVVVSLCSMNFNEETRYLLPLLPAVAVINLWLISRIANPRLVGGVIALFFLQWTAVCTRAVGYVNHVPGISYWVLPLDKDRTPAEEVTRIVHDTSGVNTYNLVGVELPWLNANSLSYFAAKGQLKTATRSYYTSLGYAAKDLDLAWKRMDDFKANYFISIEEAAQPPNPNFVNLVSIPALKRMREDANFDPAPFPSTLGVVLFRRKVNSAVPASGGQP